MKEGVPYWRMTSVRDALITRMVDVPRSAKYIRIKLHYPVLYGPDCKFIVLLQDQDLKVIGRAECDERLFLSDVSRRTGLKSIHVVLVARPGRRGGRAPVPIPDKLTLETGR